jgi:cell wall-associated NlpC family hydrolase
MAADPRLTPARPDLAAARLRGVVAAPRYAEGVIQQVAAPVARLWSGPDRQRVASELLHGEAFEVFDWAGGLAWGQAPRDSYVGYVEAAALAPPGPSPTHRVAVPLSHLYPEADVRAPPLHPLPFGSLLAATGEAGRFLVTPGGFVPAVHVRPAGEPEPDTVAVAERFLGAPYVWGGRTLLGIDCSGLVQAALGAAGLPCPRDSDQQAALGAPLPEGAGPGRGDLLFWRGHVAMMVDGGRMIHANAFHMAVAIEPAAGAIARIEAQGGGPLTAIRRL